MAKAAATISLPLSLSLGESTLDSGSRTGEDAKIWRVEKFIRSGRGRENLRTVSLSSPRVDARFDAHRLFPRFWDPPLGGFNRRPPLIMQNPPRDANVAYSTRLASTTRRRRDFNSPARLARRSFNRVTSRWSRVAIMQIRRRIVVLIGPATCH